MIIIGLDTDSFGYHWSATSALTIGTLDEHAGLKMGYIRAEQDVESRRAVTYWSALRLFKGLPPGTHVFCEEPLALKNGKTTRLLCLSAGAIWSAFIQSGSSSFWHWVDVASWKKKVTGRGNSSKDDIKYFVRQDPAFSAFVGDGPYLEMCNGNPNLYDAWCLMRYGMTLEGYEEADHTTVAGGDVDASGSS